LICHMTLLSHLKAIQYLTLNPFQQPKSFFWLVYKQQQQQQQQDTENPFLDPPFSRIKSWLLMSRRRWQEIEISNEREKEIH
jgi:hypothetical protein